MLDISKYYWKTLMREEFRRILKVIEKEFVIEILENVAEDEIDDVEYMMEVMDRISRKGCDYERLKGYCYPYTIENIYIAIRENISRLGEKGKNLRKGKVLSRKICEKNN